VHILTFRSLKDGLLPSPAWPLPDRWVVSLWLRDIPLWISAGVGFVAGSGVAVLNGLVMVSFIWKLHQEGAPLEEASRVGAAYQVAPGAHDGASGLAGLYTHGARHHRRGRGLAPPATVVIGGLISSTLLSLLGAAGAYRLTRKEDACTTSERVEQGETCHE